MLIWCVEPGAVCCCSNSSSSFIRTAAVQLQHWTMVKTPKVWLPPRKGFLLQVFWFLFKPRNQLLIYVNLLCAQPCTSWEEIRQSKHSLTGAWQPFFLLCMNERTENWPSLEPVSFECQSYALSTQPLELWNWSRGYWYTISFFHVICNYNIPSFLPRVSVSFPDHLHSPAVVHAVVTQSHSGTTSTLAVDCWQPGQALLYLHVDVG